MPSLTSEGDRRARRLYRQLLVSYLGITTTVFGLGAIALYIFVSHSLRQQLREELEVLAEAAAPSLEIAKSGSDAAEEFFAGESAAGHWHTLEQHSQSLEWFDAQGELLVREGKVFPSLVLPDGASLDTDGLLQRDCEQQLYVAILPVYEAGELAGIVRTSEAIRIVEVPLTKLRWGMVIGGCLGLGAIALSGLWLSRMALQPFLQSYQRLRQFTADASHEMRSPLAVTQAAVDSIASHTDQVSEADQINLGRIDTATRQLRRLTEALLQLARTDEAVLLVQQKIPLHELLQDLTDAFEVVAAEKNIQLKCDVLAPATVQGDGAQLMQLFTNLVQNSIKYTPSGGDVTVKLVQTKHQAIATITDTGIGIAHDDLPRVFERFWRADKVRSQQTDGLGLGLAIAYNIAERHKGDIKVESQLGKGSTFQVSLPAIVAG